MDKPRIGLITVSLPPQLSTDPPEVEKVSDLIGEHAEQEFARAGIEVIRIKEQAQNEAASIAATRQLVDAGVDGIIYLVGSWIYVPIVVAPARDLNIPFILWAVPDLMVASLVPSCITHGALDEMGIKHQFVYGAPEYPGLIDEVARFSRAAMVVHRMKGMRYGLFGGRCMYMYTGMPDLIQVKKIFGVETVHIDEFMLVEEAKRIEGRKITAFLKDFREKYGVVHPPEDVMNKSVRLYLALKSLAAENELDFVGLKCMPEVQGNYCSHCLSVALHNSEGLVTSCEADTNGALTMEILHLLSGRAAGFGDVFALGMEDKTLRLVNCGSMAVEFAVSGKDIDWGLQYDFIAPGPGRGATTVFVARPGRVTLARLARISGEYVMQIATGEAYSEPKEKMKEARALWPHIFIKLDGNPKNFLQNCRSNHQHWVYGDYREELIQICDFLNIRAIAV
ncbi:MAG: hypothetical protein PHH77_07390 [Victivallaceae bacterium]|nr:hypothetical protein [Victivallaceae bacterium]